MGEKDTPDTPHPTELPNEIVCVPIFVRSLNIKTLQRYANCKSNSQLA